MAEQDKQDAVNETVGRAFTFGKFGKNAYCIVPITDTNGRLIKIELRELLRSDMVGLALNIDSQNCSSEPLL